MFVSFEAPSQVLKSDRLTIGTLDLSDESMGHNTGDSESRTENSRCVLHFCGCGVGVRRIRLKLKSAEEDDRRRINEWYYEVGG